MALGSLRMATDSTLECRVEGSFSEVTGAQGLWGEEAFARMRVEPVPGSLHVLLQAGHTPGPFPLSLQPSQCTRRSVLQSGASCGSI